MDNPVISVIVPIFAAEQYLCECLDSLRVQTFRNFEAILIDDGSPDRSGEICDEYVSIDKRFVVVHKKNGGVSSARNAGLELARGEWLTFLDADDMYYPDALARMHNAVAKSDIDLLQFSFNTTWCLSAKNTKNFNAMTPAQYVETDLCNVIVWGSIIRTSLIEKGKIRFNEQLKYAEDQLFVFEVLRHCSKVQRIGDVLYFYRQHAMSATHRPSAEEMVRSIRTLSEYKCKYRLCEKRIDAANLYFLNYLARFSDLPSREIATLYKNVLPQSAAFANRSGKIFFWFAKLSPRLSIAIFKFIGKWEL